MQTIKDVIQNKVLVLDGAMGTMIQDYNLTESDFRGEQVLNIEGQLKVVLISCMLFIAVTLRLVPIL